MKFQKGDVVKLNDYSRRVVIDDPKNEYGLKYFLDCYTKEREPATLGFKNFETMFVVMPSNVMPVFNRFVNGKTIVYYPIQEYNNSHSKKFFVADTYLTKVGNIYDEEPEDEEEDLFNNSFNNSWDEEFNDTPEKEVNEDVEKQPSDDYVRYQEFLKISKNIGTVIDSLQSILDSLTKIAKNEI